MVWQSEQLASLLPLTLKAWAGEGKVMTIMASVQRTYAGDSKDFFFMVIDFLFDEKRENKNWRTEVP
jgi:hypothetical protein